MPMQSNEKMMCYDPAKESKTLGIAIVIIFLNNHDDDEVRFDCCLVPNVANQ